MSLWLEQIQTPEKLILAWEAPLKCPDRKRWAVGELAQIDGVSPKFRYFSRDEIIEQNDGRTLEALKSYGFVGYPAFKFEPGNAWEGLDVLKAFQRRLPDPKRPDYEKFLANFCVPISVTASTFQLMGITELRSPNDGFSVVDPLHSEWTECDLLLELAGTRHYLANVPNNFIGMRVSLVQDEGNEFDEYAVLAMIGSQKLGYINRLQARTVSEWLPQRSINSTLVRVNGTTDRPRPYIFVRVRPKQAKQAA
ncbi:hypothetical protein L5876_08385 [Hyphobacterium sp. SN044]|uniref:hypothetical protein n=1 Tax=Hyphobacterium sp. SN044 TaxID=2912575 RepID=UPI001F38EACB|nr:hypothetical protein [Hyphobacterium sp. SN044]MCF8879827.1 hypothetical protein [Hyphobacterium sp. SN044]